MMEPYAFGTLSLKSEAEELKEAEEKKLEEEKKDEGSAEKKPEHPATGEDGVV